MIHMHGPIAYFSPETMLPLSSMIATVIGCALLINAQLHPVRRPVLPGGVQEAEFRVWTRDPASRRSCPVVAVE